MGPILPIVPKVITCSEQLELAGPRGPSARYSHRPTASSRVRADYMRAKQRMLESSARAVVLRRIVEIARHVASLHNVTTDVRVEFESSSTVNHPVQTQVALSAARITNPHAAPDSRLAHRHFVFRDRGQACLAKALQSYQPGDR